MFPRKPLWNSFPCWNTLIEQSDQDALITVVLMQCVKREGCWKRSMKIDNVFLWSSTQCFFVLSSWNRPLSKILGPPLNWAFALWFSYWTITWRMVYHGSIDSWIIRLSFLYAMYTLDNTRDQILNGFHNCQSSMFVVVCCCPFAGSGEIQIPN